MYSKSTSEKYPLSIPGNYGGNALKNTTDTHGSDSRIYGNDIPGFYRSSTSRQSHTNSSNHTSFSARRSDINAYEAETDKAAAVAADEIGEDGEVDEPRTNSEAVNTSNDSTSKKSGDIKDILPESDDLLLLGMLILLMQNKGCEDLVFIILLLLLVR